MKRDDNDKTKAPDASSSMLISGTLDLAPLGPARTPTWRDRAAAYGMAPRHIAMLEMLESDAERGMVLDELEARDIRPKPGHVVPTPGEVKASVLKTVRELGAGFDFAAADRAMSVAVMGAELTDPVEPGSDATKIDGFEMVKSTPFGMEDLGDGGRVLVTRAPRPADQGAWRHARSGRWCRETGSAFSCGEAAPPDVAAALDAFEQAMGEELER